MAASNYLLVLWTCIGDDILSDLHVAAACFQWSPYLELNVVSVRLERGFDVHSPLGDVSMATESVGRD